jgi:hypothetical protein
MMAIFMVQTFQDSRCKTATCSGHLARCNFAGIQDKAGARGLKDNFGISS